jgi:predicted  nucleic acid-binding Zn-ribbon protein
MNRRDLFKFLAGIGLGAVVIETYERLYHIPMLETMFRKELEYWINQYNTAKEEVGRLTEQLRKREGEISSLRSDLTKSKEELERLIQQYNTTKEEANRLSEKLKQSKEEINNLREKASYWETQYNTTREEVGRLNSTINKLDELERESTSAITYYRGRMDEAIRKLKETIEKYRVLLGDERVSFELYTVKLLEDLKSTQEKLLRVLPYFPLILKFYWKPIKVINDKIYDINVTFEVTSPLNSLKEVEVMLIPLEYWYFITDYGMREEDYYKVFPKEEIRSVKIKPLNLERVMFSVDFEDLKGGREYIVKARVKDVAGNEKIVEVKTPYIRQFENVAKTDDITVAALYLLWWGKDNNWANYKGNIFPLLGKYSSKDKIVINKHVDWATGHGIDVFLINWSGQDYQDDALKNYFLEADLVKRGDIRFMILYESIHRLKDSNPGWNLSDPENVQILDSDLSYLSQNYFKHPSYFKINDRPVLYLYEGKGIFGDVSQIGKLKEKFGLFIISDHAHPLANPDDVFPQNNPLAVRWEDAAKQFDAILPGGGLYSGFLWYRGYFSGLPVENPLDNNKWLEYKKIGNDKWSQFARMNNMLFFPSVTVGISYRYAPWGDSKWPRLERNPQQLKERLEFELEYLKKYPKILFINEFNNFFEESQLEPDSEYGFSLLQLIKDVLRRWMETRS